MLIVTVPQSGTGRHARSTVTVPARDLGHSSGRWCALNVADFDTLSAYLDEREERQAAARGDVYAEGFLDGVLAVAEGVIAEDSGAA